MIAGRYVLRGHDAVECEDLIEWAQWLEKAERHVADDSIGDVRVSTVFLALDHRFAGGGPPLLFETMIFGGPRDGEMRRYNTWGQAEAGHAATLKSLQEGRPQ